MKGLIFLIVFTGNAWFFLGFKLIPIGDSKTGIVLKRF
jgi:hypothetical protein